MNFEEALDMMIVVYRGWAWTNKQKKPLSALRALEVILRCADEEWQRRELAKEPPPFRLTARDVQWYPDTTTRTPSNPPRLTPDVTEACTTSLVITI